MLFLLKALVAGLLIAFASKLAGRNPALAGFIIALPLTSMLALLFSYYEFRDMKKIQEFSSAILVSVPLSLVFFIPFILSRWIKMNFAVTFAAGLGLLYGAYGLQQLIMARLR